MLITKKTGGGYRKDEDKGIKAKITKAHQITNEGSKRRKEQRNYKADRKHLTKWQQVSLYLSLITLNINGLHYPIKDRVIEWIKK